MFHYLRRKVMALLPLQCGSELLFLTTCIVFQADAVMLRAHATGGKNWVFQHNKAPNNLRKQKRQFSVPKTLKELWHMNDVSIIEYRPIFTYYVTVTQLVSSIDFPSSLLSSEFIGESRQELNPCIALPVAF